MTPYGIGLGMVAPTILAHATDAGEGRATCGRCGAATSWRASSSASPGRAATWPGCRPRPVRDGDEWLVTGQKVWTSGAHLSDIGEIICRTDPDAPKHKGLTGFVVDMHAPGVEIRPLRQMTGGASFNEVFFTEVRVPRQPPPRRRQRRVGRGPHHPHERAGRHRRRGRSSGTAAWRTPRLIELVRHHGKADDPLVRQQLADIFIHGKVAQLHQPAGHGQDRRRARLPGPEMSIAKLSLTMNMRRMTDLLSSVLGPKLIADSGEWGTYVWSQFLLGLPGMRIAGGTDEVLHNIIGERVLGLPKEPPVNKELPVQV